MLWENGIWEYLEIFRYGTNMKAQSARETLLFPHVSTKNCRRWEGWTERGASSWPEAPQPWPQPMGGTRCSPTSVCSCWCSNSKRTAFSRFSWFYQFYHHHLWLSRSWSKFSAFPQSMWHIYYAAHRKGERKALEAKMSEKRLRSLRLRFCTHSILFKITLT